MKIGLGGKKSRYELELSLIPGYVHNYILIFRPFFAAYFL